MPQYQSKNVWLQNGTASEAWVLKQVQHDGGADVVCMALHLQQLLALV